jgi:hypothetical protein
LVQANSIVWVEGPSDRVYLLAWLRFVAPELIEGLHFSIMFYGGRLLSHLAASETEVGEFIELQRLNRNVAIVIDSDRRDVSSQLNETKSRVSDQVAQRDGFVWVTAGREMENYIRGEIFAQALEAVHPGREFVSPTSQWDCAYLDDAAKPGTVDKVKLAHAATTSIFLDVLDLETKLQELAAFIRKANEAA